jgi:dTDP-glucose 4,6-dehydratase
MKGDRPCVLITGGAGFIGSALVRQWLAHEKSAIVNFDKLTYAGLPQSLAEVQSDPRHLLVEGDVADAAAVRAVLEEHRPSAVLHLAAETHVDRSIDSPPEFARTNALGTCTLLDEATRYWRDLSAGNRCDFRFLLVSTDEVFGSVEDETPFSAASPLAPNSPYAASKAAAEHFARAFHRTYGLPALTINPTNNYGPRQLPEKLIPKLILAAARNEPLPLYGDGLQQRDWLHVDDCCRAIRAVLARGGVGRRYLAGTGQRCTNLEAAQRICDLVDQRLGDAGGRRRLISHVADRPGHDRLYAVDATPLRTEIGWEPKVAFSVGLAATVAWYLDHPQWSSEAAAALARREANA